MQLVEFKMARKLITTALSESQLKALRKKTFLERNKIIQDGLAKHQKMRIKMIKTKSMKKPERFIF